MHAGQRKTISRKLRHELFYESKFCCVVCQKRGSHIHHIDKDNSNNSPENLVVLCGEHHDDAHTKRELSQNLTPSYLKSFKAEWTAKVAAERQRMASLAGQKENAEVFPWVDLTWGYINHDRVAQLIDSDIIASVNKALFNRCIQSKMIDEMGIIVSPHLRRVADSPIANTIYDWFEFGDNTALHMLYSDFVDKISNRVNPIHITEKNWNKTFVRDVLKHGDFIFFIKDNFFKIVNRDSVNIHIRALARKNGLHIEYFVNSKDMFGTTSITVSFNGHKSCASLLQVKSIERVDGNVKLHCTPIALGVGFSR